MYRVTRTVTRTSAGCTKVLEYALRIGSGVAENQGRFQSSDDLYPYDLTKACTIRNMASL